MGSLAAQVTDLRGLCALRSAPGAPAVDLKAIGQRVFAAEAALVELRTFIEQEEEAETKLEVWDCGGVPPLPAWRCWVCSKFVGAGAMPRGHTALRLFALPCPVVCLVQTQECIASMRELKEHTDFLRKNLPFNLPPVASR